MAKPAPIAAPSNAISVASEYSGLAAVAGTVTARKARPTAASASPVHSRRPSLQPK